MKLRELIERLQEHAAKHGDNLEVNIKIYDGDDADYADIDDVRRELDSIIVTQQ
jgi:predicted nuclease with TOPRIM domain